MFKRRAAIFAAALGGCVAAGVEFRSALAAGTLKPLLAIVPSALPPVAPEVIQPVAAEKANSIPAELPDIAPIPIPVDPRRAPTKTPQAPAALAA